MTLLLSLLWITLFAIFSYEKPKGIAPYLIGGVLTFIIGLELLSRSDMIIFLNPSYHVQDEDFCNNDNCKRMVEDFSNRLK
jgi:hypothetical protein